MWKQCLPPKHCWRPRPGTEPATLRSVGKRATNWAAEAGTTDSKRVFITSWCCSLRIKFDIYLIDINITVAEKSKIRAINLCRWTPLAPYLRTKPRPMYNSVNRWRNHLEMARRNSLITTMLWHNFGLREFSKILYLYATVLTMPEPPPLRQVCSLNAIWRNLADSSDNMCSAIWWCIRNSGPLVVSFCFLLFVETSMKLGTSFLGHPIFSGAPPALYIFMPRNRLLRITITIIIWSKELFGVFDVRN